MSGDVLSHSQLPFYLAQARDRIVGSSRSYPLWEPCSSSSDIALLNSYGFRSHGRLAETSDANPGLSPPWSNFQPKNVWLKVRPHFGDGFSGSSEEGCFFGSFAFLPFGFGFSCSSPDSCFSCSFSLKRLFSASMIWMVSRRRVSNSAAAFRCFEVTSASRCTYDHLSAVVTSFIKGSMSTRPLF